MLQAFVYGLPDAPRTFIRGGYLAVQAFFILSGFVLAQNYSLATWNRASLLRYFGARIARIYPVYLFSLLVVSPFILDAMLGSARSFETKVSLLVDYIFVLQGWKGNLGVGWNTPAWSLTCEFFFYLCFPLLLPLLRDAGKWTLGLVIALTIVIPPILPHYGVPQQWKPIYHLSDFVAGIAVSRIFHLTQQKWTGCGAWFYLPASLASIILILHPQWTWSLRGDLNAGLRPLYAIALLGFAFGGGWLATLLSGKRADLLGKASYSLYILHVPILWWFNKWAMRRNAITTKGFAAALYVAIVIAASVIVFKWVEVPMNKRVRKLFG